MPGIEFETSAPSTGSAVLTMVAAVTIGVLVLTQGVISLLVLAFAGVLIALAVGGFVGAVRAIRANLDGDDPATGAP